MPKIESNRVVSIILAIILVLFASLAAPKLPRSITKHLENPWLRFIIFIGIAYIATQDLVTAIIAVIAVLVSYQTLAVHKITDTVMNRTTQLINTIPFQVESQPIKRRPIKRRPDNKPVQCRPDNEPVQCRPDNEPVQCRPDNELDENSDNEPDNEPDNELDDNSNNEPDNELDDNSNNEPDNELDDNSNNEPDNNSDNEPDNEPDNKPDNHNLSHDELHNEIVSFTKDVIIQNSNADNNIIIKALIDSNPNLDPTMVSKSVNMAFLEVSPNREFKNNDFIDKMSINDNEILFKTSNNYTKRNTMKYLKGNTMLLPDDYSDPNTILIDNVNVIPTLLTDKCTNEHQQNFSCKNIPKHTNEDFNGVEYDFENYGSI